MDEGEGALGPVEKETGSLATSQEQEPSVMDIGEEGSLATSQGREQQPVENLDSGSKDPNNNENEGEASEVLTETDSGSEEETESEESDRESENGASEVSEAEIIVSSGSDEDDTASVKTVGSAAGSTGAASTGAKNKAQIAEELAALDADIAAKKQAMRKLPLHSSDAMTNDIGVEMDKAEKANLLEEIPCHQYHQGHKTEFKCQSSYLQLAPKLKEGLIGEMYRHAELARQITGVTSPPVLKRACGRLRKACPRDRVIKTEDLPYLEMNAENLRNLLIAWVKCDFRCPVATCQHQLGNKKNSGVLLCHKVPRRGRSGHDRTLEPTYGIGILEGLGTRMEPNTVMVEQSIIVRHWLAYHMAIGRCFTAPCLATKKHLHTACEKKVFRHFKELQEHMARIHPPYMQELNQSSGYGRGKSRRPRGAKSDMPTTRMQKCCTSTYGGKDTVLEL